MVETNKVAEILYWYTCKPTRVSTSVYLEDKALDAVQEIDDAEIAKGDGVYAIINRLN